MHTKNLNVDQLRELLGLHKNQNLKVIDFISLLKERIGVYGDEEGILYSRKEFAELQYGFLRIKEGYYPEAAANEIYDMWYSDKSCGQ